MNGVHFPDDPAGTFHAIAVPGVAWAGENPFGDGFCVGSEAGQLALTDVQGRLIATLGQASEAGEAVNGVAHSQNWLAVTTRADISLIGPWVRGGREQHGFGLACGGLDVVVAPRSGQFVIPLGPSGLMFIKPGTAENDPVTVSSSEQVSLNFSRVLALPGTPGNDLIVCAGRRGGLGFTDFQDGIRSHTFNSVTFDNLDLVDVCSLGGLAVAAASKDGSLVLFRDILHDRDPVTVKFRGVRGVVYRLLFAQGELYLLTNTSLYALFGLAGQFLKGGKVSQFMTETLSLPFEASDANVVRDRWIVAVGVDALLRFDISKLPKSSHGVRPIEEASQAGEWEEPEDIAAQSRWTQSVFVSTNGNGVLV